MPGQMCAMHKSHVAVGRLLAPGAATTSLEIYTMRWKRFNGMGLQLQLHVQYSAPGVQRCSSLSQARLGTNDTGCCLIQLESILCFSNSLAIKADG